MSENPVPYNAGKSKQPNYVVIADFLDKYLHREMLADIRVPDEFNKDYSDMTDNEQKGFFEFVFHVLFRDVYARVQHHVGQSLSIPEGNLIKKRITLFLKQQGFDYEER